jgi:hypothetical protein
MSDTQMPGTANNAEPQATPAVESGKTIEERAKGRTLPEFEWIKEGDPVSFNQFAKVVFVSRNKSPEHEIARYLAQTKYVRIFKRAFESKHQPISRDYYCEHCVAAAVLTEGKRPEDDEFFCVLNPIRKPDTREFERLAFECQEFYEEAASNELLRGTDRRLCLQLIYAAVTQILGVLDDISNPQMQHTEKEDSEYLRILKERLDGAKSFFKRSVQREAQSTYFKGVLIGIGILVCVVLLARRKIVLFTTIDDALLFSILVGSIGAVVSVMHRMTFGDFVLNYEAGPRLLMSFGGMRPWIGAAFAGAIYCLLAGGLLPIAMPTDPTKAQYFYVGIAFIAGFSERWAQDMLSTTGTRLSAMAAKDDAAKNDGKEPAKDAAPKA